MGSPLTSDEKVHWKVGQTLLMLSSLKSCICKKGQRECGHHEICDAWISLLPPVQHDISHGHMPI